MKRHFLVHFAKFKLLAAVIVLVASAVVMVLWNRLMPELFGLHTLTYWKSVGLLVLSRILFGGFRGHRGPPMFWRHRLFQRIGQMTPEEREKFFAGLPGHGS